MVLLHDWKLILSCLGILALLMVLCWAVDWLLKIRARTNLEDRIKALIARRNVEEMAFIGMINDTLRRNHGLPSVEHWRECTNEELAKLLVQYKL